MRVALDRSIRKISFIAISFALCAIYLGFCAREFLAARLSQQPRLTSLQRAVSLEPGNAAYWNSVGRYHLLLRQEPEAALPSLKFAVALNSHRAEYWLDLSTAYQLLGDTARQETALDNAVSADPRTPQIAWKAANLYWVEGKPDHALQEFRVVAENDPYLLGPALERCWRIRPDVNAQLSTLPARADIYSAFLALLITKDKKREAAAVWGRVARLHEPVDRKYVFSYIRYLFGKQYVEQAGHVWSDAATLADLSQYQPSPSNLLVNGDFSLPILNTGFDWQYDIIPGVSLALDPTESHSGQRSLSIVFDSAGLSDAGIRQFTVVEPGVKYEFSAFFKSENLEGAGGPEFIIQDAFSGATYFSSDDLKGADFWKQVGGTFTTGPDTKLLELRVARVPAQKAIRGRLWIDGVKLVKRQSEAGAE